LDLTILNSRRVDKNWKIIFTKKIEINISHKMLLFHLLLIYSMIMNASLIT